jgi:RNA polymerase sigma factor (sigma-70 family)
MDSSDAVWLRRVADRQTDASAAADALCVLYAQFAEPINRYLFVLTHDHGLAEELLQDTFWAVWNGAGTYDGRTSVYGWVHAIARRRWRDSQRRRCLPTTDDACLLTVPSPDPSPEQVAMSRAELDTVIAAMQTLSRRHQEVLFLTLRQGLSSRDVAAALDKPEGTIKRWLFEARDALEKAVEEERRS